MHRSRSQIAEELLACIHCNECLVACPALSTPIPIKTLNQETLAEPPSPDVARFAQACCQCGACVPVCPVGLRRDTMMLWIKMRLLRSDGSDGSDVEKARVIAREHMAPPHDATSGRGVEYNAMARTKPRPRNASQSQGGDRDRMAPWR